MKAEARASGTSGRIRFDPVRSRVMPRRGSPYGPGYVRTRALLLGRPCQLRLVCDGAPADSADHWPPLAMHVHRPGTGCCVLRPACLACQARQGGELSRLRALIRLAPSPSRVW